MKPIISFVVAGVLYYAGDLASKPLRFDAFAFLYPIYNWLMCRSCGVEEWAGTTYYWRLPT